MFFHSCVCMISNFDDQSNSNELDPSFSWSPDILSSEQQQSNLNDDTNNINYPKIIISFIMKQGLIGCTVYSQTENLITLCQDLSTTNVFDIIRIIKLKWLPTTVITSFNTGEQIMSTLTEPIGPDVELVIRPAMEFSVANGIKKFKMNCSDDEITGEILDNNNNFQLTVSISIF